jgi:hypothetical protein
MVCEKKERKVIRERLRRAKVANAHRRAEGVAMELKDAIEMITENGENVEVTFEEVS